MREQKSEPVGPDVSQMERLLYHGHRGLKVTRAVFRHLPSEPRCRICIAPFAGVGGRVAGGLGFTPSRMNPNYCARCIEHMPHGGAEVNLAVLFADVRGSTSMGEQVSATEFADLMNRFYKVATQVVIGHDGIVDKLLGDEVMALFLPGFCGPNYHQSACEAGLALLRAVANDDHLRDRISLGAGVHAGPAFVGSVGGEGVFDFTALGDTVNVGARLQGQAAPGELVVSEAVFSHVDLGDAETRTATLKGKAEPMELRVVRAT